MVLPVKVRNKRRMDSCCPMKTSSGRNLRFTVHLYMKTLLTSKERERYSTGKVARKGYPRTSCTLAQMLKQMNVSRSPVATNSTSRTPGAYSNMFIFTDTWNCEQKEFSLINYSSKTYYIFKIIIDNHVQLFLQLWTSIYLRVSRSGSPFATYFPVLRNFIWNYQRIIK